MKFTAAYPLRPFQATDSRKLQQVISAYPLATIVSQCDEFPAVSQVPLIYDESRQVLQGHMDRNNPHCAELEKGGNIYCVFNGPNHYISPSIYPDEHFPGWNYVAVHVEGSVRAINDMGWLEDVLLRTARENEPAESGYELSATQRNFDHLIRYILGFEIKIVDMRGILKLAQDKGPDHARMARDHLASVLDDDVSGFLQDMLEVTGTDLANRTTGHEQ